MQSYTNNFEEYEKIHTNFDTGVHLWHKIFILLHDIYYA